MIITGPQGLAFGSGVFTKLTPANPAAGANLDVTFSAAMTRVLSMRFRLQTGVAVANRRCSIRLVDENGLTLFWDEAAAFQTASMSTTYTLALGHRQQAISGTEQVFAVGSLIPFYNSLRVLILVQNIQAADQLHTIQLLVEQF